MKSDKNNHAFIDSQNLHLSIKDLGWTLDMERFRIYLKDKYNVEKAFLFIGYIKGNEAMYTKFQQWGYVVIFKPTLEANGVIKGNCDAELVLHCMIEKEVYDNAIIVLGDGDFHCLIEHLIEEKKLLKVGIPNKKNYSSLLVKFRHPYFFYINSLKDKLEYKKRPNK
ncbi:NYN domain-containing protein [Patescibacteria group bacterium]|nr:NYN domain-containing protein [Patescibacteria group bacterium]